MNSLDIQELAKHAVSLERLLFITGAGVSVDSGLPTYRGVAGLYDHKETEDGIPIEVALSGSMIQSRPELTWKYLMQIGEACRGKTWNRGHSIIAEFERQLPGTWLLTQNIDGFHRDAGSKNLIEIHGTMRKLFCTECAVEFKSAEFELNHLPPQCPVCGGLIRPTVVLFDEMLPDEAVAQLSRQLQIGFDLIVVVGTSALFPYIANPVHQARFSPCLTVEINPDQTSLSEIVDIKLELGATDGLLQLAEVLGIHLEKME